MTASDLIRRLVREGVAQPMADHGAETLPRATAGGIGLAVSRTAGDAAMRAEWRKRTDSPPCLLLADDPKRTGRLRVLGPVTHKSSVRSVDAGHLAKALEALAGPVSPRSRAPALTADLNRAASVPA